MSDAQPLQAQPRPRLTSATLAVLHERLHDVAQQTIEAVSVEVPGYRDTLDAGAQATLAQAVETALGGFLALAAADRDASAPLTPALDGALILGRVEAQQGRSMDALLAAYRVGARVAWRGLAGAAAQAGLPAQDVVVFAELVFAYIDALSAASVAGHAAELAIADRARARALERLAEGLLLGGPEEAMRTAAQEAGWNPPTGMAAVVLPAGRVDAVLARIDPRTLVPSRDLPELPRAAAVLLIADPDDRLRDGLARGLGTRGAVVGPVRPWLGVRASYLRAVRGWELGLASSPVPDGDAGPGRDAGPGAGGRVGGSRSADRRGGGRIVDTEEHLPELLVGADPGALADLRERALAPLAGLRPAVAQRLSETLRVWLLHRGRRDEVAAALFVHPQTVRYRMGQLRALYGAALDDPRVTLELTLALTLDPLRRSGAAD
ncbi:MAG: helix-turn-helix domain-containing protein [Candidatus Nanopelagicales bacterium]